MEMDVKSLPLLGCILLSSAAMAAVPDCIRLDELSPSIEGIHNSEGHSCLLVEISNKQYIRQEGMVFQKLCFQGMISNPFAC